MDFAKLHLVTGLQPCENWPMSKLSIITAVHNALPMNRLFWKALSENTVTPFELILIDNHSTDGTEAFFSALARETQGTNQEVIYVRNEKNQWYAASQNQGLARSRYDILCFLNNDVWMPKGWEKPFIEALSKNPLFVLSPSGQEAQPTQTLSDRLKNKWKKALLQSKAWKTLFRKTEEDRLWKSLEIMYGDLEKFQSPTPVADASYMHGIKGDVVIFSRKLLKKVPEPWNESVEAPDWHLYLSIAKLHEDGAFIPLPRVLLNSYVHHFGRYSAKQENEPIGFKEPLKSLESLWNEDLIKKLWWGNHLPA